MYINLFVRPWNNIHFFNSFTVLFAIINDPITTALINNGQIAYHVATSNPYTNCLLHCYLQPLYKLIKSFIKDQNSFSLIVKSNQFAKPTSQS